MDKNKYKAWNKTYHFVSHITNTEFLDMLITHDLYSLVARKNGNSTTNNILNLIFFNMRKRLGFKSDNPHAFN